MNALSSDGENTEVAFSLVQKPASKALRTTNQRQPIPPQISTPRITLQVQSWVRAAWTRLGVGSAACAQSARATRAMYTVRCILSWEGLGLVRGCGSAVEFYTKGICALAGTA